MLKIIEVPLKHIRIIQKWFELHLNMEVFKYITKNSKLVFLAEGDRKIFLVSDMIWDSLKAFKSKRNPSSLGIYFGELTNGRFQISLPIIQKIVTYKDFSEYEIVLNEKGEQHFLYGRNPQKRHIIKTPKDATKGSIVIPLSIHGDPLGLGKLKVPTLQIPKLAAETVIIKNIIDLGWYLRRGK